MLVQMTKAQAEAAEKSQRELRELASQVEELQSRAPPPPPPLPLERQTPAVLEQVAQLLQNDSLLSTIQHRIRQEVIQPGLEEQKANTEESFRTHAAELTTRVVSKVDKAKDLMVAMSRWADNIKKDIDPGLLLPPPEPAPAST